MMQFEKVRSIKVPLNADCRGGYKHFHKGSRLKKKNIGFQNNLILRKIKRYRGLIQSENYKTW